MVERISGCRRGQQVPNWTWERCWRDEGIDAPAGSTGLESSIAVAWRVWRMLDFGAGATAPAATLLEGADMLGVGG